MRTRARAKTLMYTGIITPATLGRQQGLDKATINLHIPMNSKFKDITNNRNTTWQNRSIASLGIFFASFGILPRRIGNTFVRKSVMEVKSQPAREGLSHLVGCGVGDVYVRGEVEGKPPLLFLTLSSIPSSSPCFRPPLFPPYLSCPSLRRWKKAGVAVRKGGGGEGRKALPTPGLGCVLLPNTPPRGASLSFPASVSTATFSTFWKREGEGTRKKNMLGFPPLVWPNNSLSTAFESGVGETERNSNTSNTLDDRWRYYVHTLAHEYERHGLREKRLLPPPTGWLWFRRRRAEDSFFPPLCTEHSFSARKRHIMRYLLIC